VYNKKRKQWGIQCGLHADDEPGMGNLTFRKMIEE